MHRHSADLRFTAFS